MVSLGCAPPAEIGNRILDFVGLQLNIGTFFVGLDSAECSRDRDSSTEYLYGIFSNVDSLNTTQLIGSPSSYTVQSLSIQGPIVAASVIVAFDYKTIDYSLPVQIDLWLIFNDDLKLEGYDATFRRFPQALNYLLPKLGPQMAKELAVEYDPSQLSAIVAQRSIIDICTATQEFCTGGLTQYDS